MCNTWELDSETLAKINEYLESNKPMRARAINNVQDLDEALGHHKRARISGFTDGCDSSHSSDESDASGSDHDGVYQPECVICSESFQEHTDIGIPMGCLHVFCYVCIKKWSNRTNVCPICKSEFNELCRFSWKQLVDFLSSTGRRKLQRLRTSRIFRIKNFKTLKERLIRCLSSIPSQREKILSKLPTDEAEDGLGGCVVCGRDDNWEQLLLCDGCNLGFHLLCLDPPLMYVPQGDWYCKICLESQDNQREQTSTTSRARRRNTRGPVRRSSRRRLIRPRRERVNADTVYTPYTATRSRSAANVANQVVDAANEDLFAEENLFTDDEATAQPSDGNEHTVVSHQTSNSNAPRSLVGHLFNLGGATNRGNNAQTSQMHNRRTVPDIGSLRSRPTSSVVSTGLITTRTRVGNETTLETSDTNTPPPRTPEEVPKSTGVDVIEASLHTIGEFLNDTSTNTSSYFTPLSSLDEYAFDATSLSAPKSQSSNTVDHKTGSGEMGIDSKPARSVSFIYRYRKIMENNRNSDGTLSAQSPPTRGSSLTHFF
ncbi:PHD and RING finger domain-containing protein 1 [Babesia sp. Xinjiang]|uniref:PHD and RING finger domain-containing protein 1 n=1 Tax=Babesia sp. Xinjiang TaxID=462227 RepID=UPI000A22C07D|nr:PHD and RING finger domain-containing protein 1 [Babesia sp. Xinjiang]ORM40306.1 PHD and RING finger domain-containing protein 1 [Babesia sp. Xinjiang]